MVGGMLVKKLVLLVVLSTDKDPSNWVPEKLYMSVDSTFQALQNHIFLNPRKHWPFQQFSVYYSLGMILCLFCSYLGDFRTFSVKNNKNLITYLESASKTESTYVCFMHFQELFFSSKISPLVPLRGRSKNEFHQNAPFNV